ncbi:MAG TPA: hypothetical protein PLK12_12220, partial [Prolixibacteraceae bacterium]|nr:hypothetical protein [Prolixibacteraceae bacterium]
HLHKMIPPGAGLGGGSSDASHALLVLNQLFALHLSDDALRDRALQLGSDCPYFLYNRPLFAEGRGELFSEVRVNLRNYRIVLVKPPCSVSTSLAYQNIKPVPAKYLLRQEIGQDPVRWGEKISNDFETQVFPAFPEIRLIKERMIEQGAVYASMSGSGSAVFGIFPETAGSFREEFPGLFYWEEAGKDF